VAAVARRIKIPPSILLVVAGVVLALVPGLPAVELRRSWYCSWCCRRSSTPRRWR
jgi:hypothetical protein